MCPSTLNLAANGANWTWAVFENATNPPLEIIANPDPSGINTSATVAKFTALAAGNPWAGCESMHGADLGPFVLGRLQFHDQNHGLEIGHQRCRHQACLPDRMGASGNQTAQHGGEPMGGADIRFL
jgi:hypothetical protein